MWPGLGEEEKDASRYESLPGHWSVMLTIMTGPLSGNLFALVEAPQTGVYLSNLHGNGNHHQDA